MHKIKLTSEHVKSIATLLDSGLSSLEVFTYIRDTFFKTSTATFEPLLDSISSGDDFTSIFSYTNLSDNHIYTHLIKSSQANGSISDGLRDICADIDIQNEYLRSFVQILMYPLIVSLVLGLTIFAILIYVLPQLKPIILVHTGHVPVVTTWLMSVSSLLTTHTFAICIGIVGSILMIVSIYMRPGTKRYVYHILFFIPILSSIITQYTWAQIARVLFYYTKSGSSISDAFQVVITLRFMPYRYKKICTDIHTDIVKGLLLSDSVRLHRDIPMIWMLYMRIGESKIGYNNAFLSIKRIHEANMLRYVSYIQKTIEPILMICIGCIVGVFAYAILVPIYGLINTLQP